MLRSAPLCSANIHSCKMCLPHSSYQTYHSKTSKPVRILRKVLTSKLVNTLKLKPTIITHLLFSEICLVLLVAFLCNSQHYQKENFRHLVVHVTFYSFCFLGGVDLLVKLLSKETIQGDEKSFQIKNVFFICQIQGCLTR